MACCRPGSPGSRGHRSFEGRPVPCRGDHRQVVGCRHPPRCRTGSLGQPGGDGQAGRIEVGVLEYGRAGGRQLSQDGDDRHVRPARAADQDRPGPTDPGPVWPRHLRHDGGVLDDEDRGARIQWPERPAPEMRQAEHHRLRDRRGVGDPPTEGGGGVVGEPESQNGGGVWIRCHPDRLPCQPGLLGSGGPGRGQGGGDALEHDGGQECPVVRSCNYRPAEPVPFCREDRYDSVSTNQRGSG